jgi:hypothetical protein
MLFAQMEETLGATSITVLEADIPVGHPGSTVQARNELLILPTVYVEAFVDQDQRVLAYTVTARKQESMPTVDAGNRTFELGSTRVSEAFEQDDMVEEAAGACGARTISYYEISATSGAQLNRTIAIGTTAAGALPEDYTFPGCRPESLYGLPLASPITEDISDVEIHQVTGEYLQQTSDYRSDLVINTVTFTAPGMPIAPEMISLHPQTVNSYDPDK